MNTPITAKEIDSNHTGEFGLLSNQKNRTVNHEKFNQSLLSTQDCNELSEIKKLNNAPLSSNLFQLFIKNGQYIFARAYDIILVESSDHWIKIYVACGDSLTKTVRHDSLKNFLRALPVEYFIRLGRFCIINTQRLTGGNHKEQTFDFDFKFKIKLKHQISSTIFCNLGK